MLRMISRWEEHGVIDDRSCDMPRETCMMELGFVCFLLLPQVHLDV